VFSEWYDDGRTGRAFADGGILYTNNNTAGECAVPNVREMPGSNLRFGSERLS
jgi:hypothetical protein